MAKNKTGSISGVYAYNTWNKSSGQSKKSLPHWQEKLFAEGKHICLDMLIGCQWDFSTLHSHIMSLWRFSVDFLFQFVHHTGAKGHSTLTYSGGPWSCKIIHKIWAGGPMATYPQWTENFQLHPWHHVKLLPKWKLQFSISEAHENIFCVRSQVLTFPPFLLKCSNNCIILYENGNKRMNIFNTVTENKIIS